MRKKFLLLAGLSLFLQPLYSDCVDTRDTTVKEQNFSKEIVEKFKTLAPLGYDGWDVKKQNTNAAPPWICSATGYEPVTGIYTIQFRRSKKEAKERRKAFRRAYKKGAKMTTGEEREYALLKKERSELIKKTRGKRSKSKPDQARMMALAEEMQAAMKAKDKKRVEEIQKEYLAAAKGGSTGDPDLDRKMKVEELMKELKDRKNKRGLENARNFAGDMDFKLSIHMNRQYKSIKDVKKIEVKNSKAAFVSEHNEVDLMFFTNKEVTAYILFGHWNIEESNNRYTLKMDTGKSKKVRRVRTVLMSITASEKRLAELLRTLPLADFAALVNQ